jgi:hypothetical protein
MLEKVRAQAAELRTLKGRVAQPVDKKELAEIVLELTKPTQGAFGVAPVAPADPRKEVESALKALQQAGTNKELLHQATEKLEAATKKLREQLKDPRLAPKTQEGSKEGLKP